MFPNIKKPFGKAAYSKIFLVILLCCVGIIVYSNTFRSPFQFDDKRNILESTQIRDLSNLKAIASFPRTRFITFLTFALNYHFHKYDVFGYHLVNLIIHLSSAIMVWWLTLITLSTPRMKDNKISSHSTLIAFFTALIFVAHPVQIQAVTYIIQRATSLVAFFYIASLCFYARFRLSQINNLSLRNCLFYLLVFFVAAASGMFTKELIVTLPLMIILYEICFLRIKDYFRWKYLIALIILFAVIYIAIVFPRFMSFSSLKEALEARKINVSPGLYILTQSRVLVTYLRLLLVPVNQTIIYDYRVAKSILQPQILASIFLLLALLISAFKLYPKYRLISFGIFWFFFALSQEFTIMPLYFFLMSFSREIIFEERLYLPMVGYSFFLVSTIYYIFGQRNLRRMIIILLIIASSYAVLTYNRNFVWKDEFTLWDDTVRKSPMKSRPYNNRGRMYAERGDYDEAIEDFTKTIQLWPAYADAYYNRGHVFADKGEADRAIADYTKVTEINPTYVKAYYNRGNVYKTKGDIDRAISDYNKALQISPAEVKAYVNRGNAYSEKGDINRAISDYTKAIEINPNFFEVYFNRGNAYGKKGNFDGAISDYSTAIELNPERGVSYYNRSIVYFRKGQYDEAWRDVHKAESLGYKVSPDFLQILKKASETLAY